MDKKIKTLSDEEMLEVTGGACLQDSIALIFLQNLNVRKRQSADGTRIKKTVRILTG